MKILDTIMHTYIRWHEKLSNTWFHLFHLCITMCLCVCVNTEHKRKDRKNHNQMLAGFDHNGRISGIFNVLYTFYIFIRSSMD